MIFKRRRKGDKKKDQEDSSENPQGPNAPEDNTNGSPEEDPDNPEGENPNEDPNDYRSKTGYPRWPGWHHAGGQRGGFNNNRPRTGFNKPDAGWDKPEPGPTGTDGTARSTARPTQRARPERERPRRRRRRRTLKGSQSSSSG